jgi:lipid A ethanolaminephosphotransferase
MSRCSRNSLLGSQRRVLNFSYVMSLIPFQALLLMWIISFLTFHSAYRYVLSLLLLMTALSSYFSDAYGVVIDRGMLINAMETNTAEARDLMSLQLLLYVLGIFVLPTLWLFRINVREQTFIKRVGAHFITGITALIIASANCTFHEFVLCLFL